jgi:predicted nuclease of predicted toxin-antitoxin system
VKILVDVNLAFRWASLLTSRGIESVPWAVIGKSNAPDTEIMTHAATNGYSVLTNDLDFSAILAATGKDKPSVIQIRATDTRPEGLIDTVVQTINQMCNDIEQGAIVTIDINKARVHLLPLA